MGGFVVFVIVLIFVIVAKALKGSSASSEPTALRPGQLAVRAGTAAAGGHAAAQRTQQGSSSSGWTAPNVTPSVPAGPPGATRQQPGPAPYAAAARWIRNRPGRLRGRLPRRRRAPGPAPTAWPAPIEAAQELIADLRDDPQVRPFLPDLDPHLPRRQPNRRRACCRQRRPSRYVGSAALESTLDSLDRRAACSASPSALEHHDRCPTSLVGQPVELPPEVEARVLALLSDGHEVAAVRLICDETNCRPARRDEDRPDAPDA